MIMPTDNKNMFQMDREFDFRALLLKIQDRLSNDDRHRLHFLVGDIIPRMQREDVTLAGTLTLLESLFDRAVINQDYFEFLIRIFQEIQCHDAVKRLQEYQLPKEHKSTHSDVLDDNLEEDKYPSTSYEQLTSIDSNSDLLYKPNIPNKTTVELLLTPTEKSNIQNRTTTESMSISSETPVTNEKPPINTTSEQTPKTFFKLLLIFCLYGLFFLQILALFIYLWIVRKKLPLNSIQNRYHQDAYILQPGKFLDNIDGKWFNHSENLSLTYIDRLIQIDTYVYHDDMYSIKFIYSQNKTVEHQLKTVTRFNQPVLSSLDLEKRNVQDITQCYKTNNRSTRLVGLHFYFKDKSSVVFGSCHQQTHLEDKFSNHIFGYAVGKISEYLNGFQFIWYKICPLHNRVTLCANPNLYNLLADAFYKD